MRTSTTHRVLAGAATVLVGVAVVIVVGGVFTANSGNRVPESLPTVDGTRADAISCTRGEENWGQHVAEPEPDPDAALAAFLGEYPQAPTTGYEVISESDGSQYREARVDRRVAAGVSLSNGAQGWGVTWFQFCSGNDPGTQRHQEVEAAKWHEHVRFSY